MGSLPIDEAPTLPPNVFIFSPSAASTAKALLNGHMFTRLVASAGTEPSQLAAALRSQNRPEVDESFCVCHRNAVLIFDSDSDGKDLEDVHHEHFRAVCLALKDHNISLSVSGCVFDAPNVLQAGFQLEELSSGSVLVIDIVEGNDSDDDDDDDP